MQVFEENLLKKLSFFITQKITKKTYILQGLLSLFYICIHPPRPPNPVIFFCPFSTPFFLLDIAPEKKSEPPRQSSERARHFYGIILAR